MRYSLVAINAMDQAAFIEAFGPTFEHTPAIAAQAWEQRPFQSLEDLHRAMVAVMRSLPEQQQLALIRAHPELGSRAKMAPASVDEQSSAGLDQLTPQEFDALQQLNRQYQARFGFPFIIAVKHHSKASILAALRQRLGHSPKQEQAAALDQIAEIARLRLAEVTSP